MSARSGRESPVTIHGWLLYPLIGVFIALKLTGVTDWSWWWVFSPLWIAAALVVVVAGAMALLFASLTLYFRIRLRFRLRRAVPEVFIDPAAWSRIAADRPDTASSLRVTRYALRVTRYGATFQNKAFYGVSQTPDVV
jgi:MFS family permease